MDFGWFIMNDTQKKEYGQFFSTKAEYLFSNFPKTKLPVVEPFYGDGDLLLGQQLQDWQLGWQLIEQRTN